MSSYVTSLPTRERGLKYAPARLYRCMSRVAPHAGAWIEIIELLDRIADVHASHPTRERGLK